MARQPVKYLGPTVFHFPMMAPHKPKLYKFTRSGMSLIGIDPGGVTGWSIITLPAKVQGADIFSLPFEEILKRKSRWIHGQIDCHEENRGVDTLCRNVIDVFYDSPVVVEAFFIRKMAADLSPARISAVVQHHLYLRDRLNHLHFQQPSIAKTTVTDDRLKLWNCYTSTGGLNHARDADRHVLTTIRRCVSNHKLAEEFWPHIYDPTMKQKWDREND